MLRLTSFLCLIWLTFNIHAQAIEQIHLKKNNQNFVFFQKGKACDTIVCGRSDLFYLLITDTLKQQLIIETENAQINSSSNDSLVLIKYIPGIKYLNKFVAEEKENNLMTQTSKNKKTKISMITLIDGASNSLSQKIKINFIYKFSHQSFAEFTYFAK